MEKITEQVMTELLSTEASGPAVTIYAPMHTSASPPHMTEDQIRLKNLIHEAQSLLEQHAEGHKMSNMLQEQLDKALNDQSFWESQTQGLLLCARPGSVRLFHLPVDTEAYVAVDDTFHLTPLLGLMHDAQDFYLLAIAQHNPTLYKGTMYGLEETGIALPESVEAGLNIDENNQKSEQSLSAGGSSMNTNAFNGRGGARDPREEDRARFMRMVDRIIIDKADRTLPLVLAGTDAEVAEYRGYTKYPKVLAGSINKGTNNVLLETLFDEAQAIVTRELITPQHQQIVADYERMQATATDRTADNAESIRQAAEQGRVGTLLLGMSRLTTDTVRDSDAAVQRITFPQDSFKDAVNSLALAVHNTSGEVIILDESAMPNSSQMAAVLRY